MGVALWRTLTHISQLWRSHTATNNLYPGEYRCTESGYMDRVEGERPPKDLCMYGVHESRSQRHDSRSVLALHEFQLRRLVNYCASGGRSSGRWDIALFSTIPMEKLMPIMRKTFYWLHNRIIIRWKKQVARNFSVLKLKFSSHCPSNSALRTLRVRSTLFYGHCDEK